MKTAYTSVCTRDARRCIRLYQCVGLPLARVGLDRMAERANRQLPNSRHCQRQDGDVIFLAELLGGSRDLLRGHEGEAGEALEAVEFSGLGTRFRNAVRKQDETLSRCQSATAPVRRSDPARCREATMVRFQFAPGKIGSDVTRRWRGVFADSEMLTQQAVVKPSWPCAISALLRPKRISPGSCEVSRRRTPRIMATRIAAVKPFPETSPTIAVRDPSGAEDTKKKSPPTSLAGKYTDST